MKQVTLFSDGSCLGNPGNGGWAFILSYKNHELKKSGFLDNTTNNQMEITAVIEGLKCLKEPCEVEIYTDSEYVVNSINSWIINWIKKDFAGIKNVELWKEFLKISKKHKIKAFWVKGHNGHPQNEWCDKYARNAALTKEII